MRRARGSQPRICREAGPGGRARAGHGRPAHASWASRTGSTERASSTTGIELRYRRPGPPDPVRGARRGPGDHDLRPAGGGQGPDRRAARCGRRRCSSRSTTSRLHGIDSDEPSIRFTHEGVREGAALRCDRRLRRLPRRLPPVGARRRPELQPARLSVRLARHPRPGRALDRGADLRAPRARLRAAQPALARAQPPLRPVRSRATRSSSGPTSGSGRSCTCGSPATTAGP